MQQPVLVEATLPPVLVNGTATVLVQVVHSRPCSQMLLPPHSTVAVVARAPVLAEAAAATLLALAALPPVLAEAATATLLAVAVVALPPVLAAAAAAAAFLALAAQPPVLAAAAYLAPHGPQTMRARCATRTANEPSASSQSTSAQTADPRSQERSSGEEEKQEGSLN